MDLGARSQGDQEKVRDQSTKHAVQGFQLLSLSSKPTLSGLSFMTVGQALGKPPASNASQIPAGLCQQAVRPGNGILLPVYLLFF